MVKFLLWCILLVLCWPLALLALVLYPFVWLILLPFRLAGVVVEGVLALLVGIILLPSRLLRGPVGHDSPLAYGLKDLSMKSGETALAVARV